MGNWRQSSLNTMMTCPERFRRQYLVGEETGTSAAALIGTAVHKAAENALCGLMEGIEPLAIDCQEWAASAFDRLVEEDRQGPDPIPWTCQETLDERRAEVVGLARLWAGHALEIVERHGFPTMVEQQFKDLPFTMYHDPDAPLSSPPRQITLTGTMDCATDRHVLIDWKTATRNWKPGRALKQLQAIFYAAAYEELTGIWPEQFVFVVLTRGSTKRLYEHVVPLPAEKKDLLVRLLVEYDKQKAKGIFPLNTTSNLCSEEYCPFWKTCPASVLGG
jgi:hypothetical protein